MTLTFFDAADKTLFSRPDAESASWTVEEMTLTAVFPYVAGKEILRGMRVGFTDDDGNFQAFEVRKVKTTEPDHYQEISAEHIAVAELTDEVYPAAKITDETAGAVLADVLDGTLWSVGRNTASGTSSANFSNSQVWSLVRSIESNWNVYITPRITVNSTGITGRYLDIAPAKGAWRGIRLSVDKNADEVGVTVDDTETVTAMYGYGGKDADGNTLTFADVVWSATSSHPAKPRGQTYIEDPAATAAYGRNGRPRYAFWSNSGIKDASVLLQKTWAYLKTTNAPKVSIDGTVTDLHRLGYADEPLRLHDLAIVEIAQTGTQLQKEIIRLTVDLIDPTNTRVTIGAYIPNIIYIDRDTNDKARGGGGGGRGNTPNEDEYQEFVTNFARNQYMIEQNAQHIARNGSILQQAGMYLDANNVLVYATDNERNVASMIKTQADRISLVVEGTGDNASIKRAAIILAINRGVSSASISADVIDIDGMVQKLTSKAVIAESLTSLTSLIVRGSNSTFEGSISAAGTIGANEGFFTGGNTATWQSKDVVTSLSTTRVATAARYFAITDANMSGITGALSANPLNTVTGNTTKIYYLGRTPT